jgi:hypothetical protein
MHARGSNRWSIVAGVGLLLGLATPVSATPKPQPVDIKPFRDQLVVLTDADGGIYVALPGSPSRLWYGARGKTKNLYEQVVTGRSANEDRWDISVYAPRVPNMQPGSVGIDANGGFYRYCGANRKTPLTLVPGDKATAILDGYTFLTSATIRAPYLLARDSFGVYYYVDHIRSQYGGKGYRVFIGKKGAMKERPLVDIATDSAGDVFGTKTGDLHLIRNTSDEPVATPKVSLVRGDKETKLMYLDVTINSVLIFKDLGIYGFTGSICESL